MDNKISPVAFCSRGKYLSKSSLAQCYKRYSSRSQNVKTAISEPKIDVFDVIKNAIKSLFKIGK